MPHPFTSRIVLLVSLLFPACTTSPTRPTTLSAAPPIIYSPNPDCAPLNPQQMAAITRDAESLCPPECTLWFIFVRFSDTKDHGRYRVTVYFSPETQTARLRKGFCVSLRNFSAFHEGPPKPRLSRYIQVSEASAPFATTLGVPTIPLLPFPPVDTFSDPDIVALVDYVRAYALQPPAVPIATREPDGSITMTLPDLPSHLDPDSPILFIRLDGDEINVHFGWLAGPLYGGGKALTLRRTPQGYHVVSRASWVS